jgi:hypothetical protein
MAWQIDGGTLIHCEWGGHVFIHPNARLLDVYSFEYLIGRRKPHCPVPAVRREAVIWPTWVVVFTETAEGPVLTWCTDCGGPCNVG